MALANDRFSQLLAQRCQESFEQDAAARLHGASLIERRPLTSCPDLNLQHSLDDPDLDFLSGVPDFLEDSDTFDLSHLLDLQPEELLQDIAEHNPYNKRKAADSDDCNAWKKTKQDSTLSEISPLLFQDLDRPITVDSGQSLGLCSYSQDSSSSHDSLEESPRSRPEGLDLFRSSSPCSDISDQSYCGQSVEYHFQKIQDHVRLAVEALKRGQYEHNKNIVTWAHELKNKTFSEVLLCRHLFFCCSRSFL